MCCFIIIFIALLFQLQFSTMNSQPEAGELKKGASSQPSTSRRHSSTGSRSPGAGPISPSIRTPLAVGRFGVGELPMPVFSLESAGVMPTGGIDHSVKLETAERAEKVIKTGVVCFLLCASNSLEMKTFPPLHCKIFLFVFVSQMLNVLYSPEKERCFTSALQLQDNNRQVDHVIFFF